MSLLTLVVLIVVGVLLGSAGTFDTAVQQVAEATGENVTTTASRRDRALSALAAARAAAGRPARRGRGRALQGGR